MKGRERQIVVIVPHPIHRIQPAIADTVVASVGQGQGQGHTRIVDDEHLPQLTIGDLQHIVMLTQIQMTIVEVHDHIAEVDHIPDVVEHGRLLARTALDHQVDHTLVGVASQKAVQVIEIAATDGLLVRGKPEENQLEIILSRHQKSRQNLV